MQEKIMQIKSCKQCNSKFEITDKDLEFYEKVSPKFDGKTYKIPSPALCPDCRQQRRLSWRNERNLYKRKCDSTGKDIISVYSPDKIYKVYNQDFWWSDKWNALDYGQDFNFSKPFFEQFDNLVKKVPRYNTYNFDTENCEFVQYMPHSKDCYLCFGGWYNQKCFYGDTFVESVNSLDSSYCFNGDTCYENIDTKGCYKCFYSYKSENCSNSYFIYNCINCKNCLGCWNIQNKKYFILNKQYSKEDYKKKIKDVFNNYTSLIKFTRYFNDLIKKNAIRKDLDGENNIDCLGDKIYNGKKCVNSYMIWGGEDISFLNRCIEMKDSYDLYGCGKGERLYDSISCDFGYEVYFSKDSENCKNIFLSDCCDSSSNLFGCIGLRNKEYCILNKQYTKEKYNKLVPKIIEHMKKTREWGEFFPSSISPFGYNETVAEEYFPLTREEVIGKDPETSSGGQSKLIKGKTFNWSDYEAPFPKVEKIIPAEKLPEDIKDIPDDILNRAIECEVSGKPFKIIKQELEFYRKHGLPIPRKHPNVRHLERMKLRNPRKLFDRKCDKCGKDMKSTYSPDREEIVYCEGCYEKEVY